ncbi:MAG: hypothetical protein WB791_06420 [Waddliaceae bacterium]
MWPKSYKDYPVDSPLVQQQVEPGRGIVGCEMHDLNGWGEEHHIPAEKQRKGIVSTLLFALFGRQKKGE